MAAMSAQTSSARRTAGCGSPWVSSGDVIALFMMVCLTRLISSVKRIFAALLKNFLLVSPGLIRVGSGRAAARPQVLQRLLWIASLRSQ